MNELTKQLCDELRRSGAALVGFGDLSELPEERRRGMPVGVSVLVRYPAEVIRGIRELPTKEYYAHYNALNEQLDRLVTAGEEFLQRRGYEADARTRAKVGQWDDAYTTPLPHKTAATRAGLGWIGKCALFVTREYGSAVRLSTILTNAPLDTGTPVNQSSCGDCAICAAACPGQAVSGRNWAVDMQRDDFFNAQLCRKALREQTRKGLGEEKTVCGRCIAVCPHTMRYTGDAFTR